MPEAGYMDSVFEAIKPRLNGALASVLTGGFRLAEMPELDPNDPKAGHRPYGIVQPVAVRDKRFTNKRQYANVVFAFEVHADTFTELDGTILNAVRAAIRHVLTGEEIQSGAITVHSIRDGDEAFDKIEQIWMGSVEFTVSASQAIASSVQ